MAEKSPIRTDRAVAVTEARSEPMTDLVAAWLTPPTPYSRMASGSNRVFKLTRVGWEGIHMAGEAFQSVVG